MKKILVAVGFWCVASLVWAQAETEREWGVSEQPAVVNAAVRSEHQRILSLSGEWDFVADGAWWLRLSKGEGVWGDSFSFDGARKILVPGCWEAQGVGEPGPAQSWNCVWDRCFWQLRNVYMGPAAYRKTFSLPKDWEGKTVFLKIGGVRSEAYLWVNSKRAAYTHNYCAATQYDITPFLKPGENEIIALVRNDVPSRKGCLADPHRFGGFYRDIELEAVPTALAKLPACRIRCDFEKQVVLVELPTVSMPDTSVSIQFLDAHKKAVMPTIVRETPETQEAQTVLVPMKSFQRWSPEEPNLYTVQIVWKDAAGRPIHGVAERFGVREWKVVGDQFYLNGKPYFLRGLGDHNFDSLNLVEPPDRDRYIERLQLYKTAGFNFIRFHTHCPVPEYFEAADEVGMMLQPELPYYHDVQTEGAEFAPIRDAKELLDSYGRYASLAVLSTGNEGWLGSPVDQKLYESVKNWTNACLVIHQDGGRNMPGNSDFGTGPIRPWPAGEFADGGRPFIAHEYLNLAIKPDPRLEERFTGARLSPVSKKAWQELLAKCSLTEAWGIATLEAAGKLQAIYQKQGLESARRDPACDGYSFWSAMDVGEASQGYLNVFGEIRSSGILPQEFYHFNGPTVLLADANLSQPIATSGEKISFTFRISHYAATDIPAGELEWTRGESSGRIPTQRITTGTAGVLAEAEITVPQVSKPVLTELKIRLAGTTYKNQWNFWIFPVREKPSLAGVAVSPKLLPWFQEHYTDVTTEAKPGDALVVQADETDVLEQAISQGRRILLISPASSEPDVALGWWSIGSQVGTAFAVEHPAFHGFPLRPYMDELWFRLIRKDAHNLQTPLSLNALQPLAVGEGADTYYLYLGEGNVGDARIMATYALALLQDKPEALALLDCLVKYIQHPEVKQP